MILPAIQVAVRAVFLIALLSGVPGLANKFVTRWILAFRSSRTRRVTVEYPGRGPRFGSP